LTGITAENIRGILLDIEGTTTSISFVYDVLFPYARQHVREFLQKYSHDAPVRDALARLHEQHANDVRQALNPPPVPDRGWLSLREPLLRAKGGDTEVDAIISYINWLMDRDSKAEPLKALQGMIWEEGYTKGDVQGHVFPDVPAAFERWRKEGKAIAIFSSGSVLAQKLLFGRTIAGDLKPFIKNYFDTTTGPKRQPQSYRAIAGVMGLRPKDIVFISDVTEELDAAAVAGMTTLLCSRPGNHPQPSSQHTIIRSFDEIA
jgi:enolase-phosphatase E1